MSTLVTCLFLIFNMCVTQLIANSYAEKTKQDLAKAKFAWVPIYSWFVLAKLTTIPSVVAWIIVLSTTITSDLITFFDINLHVGLGLVLLIFAHVTAFVGTLSINYKIAEVHGYSSFAAFLATFLNPFVWIVFLITDRKNKNNI